MQNRVLVSRWLCDWFGRELAKHSGTRSATDAECEKAVNDQFPKDPALFGTDKEREPVFETEKRAGGMWQKARTGTRPFSPERLAQVAEAASKLKFWMGPAHSNTQIDRSTFYLLKLATFDKLRDEKTEKRTFKLLQQKMLNALKTLANSNTAAKFQNAKKRTASALNEWVEFVDALPSGVGEIVLRYDLEASFQCGNGDFIYHTLKPKLAQIWVDRFQFGAANRQLYRLSSQVWALEFSPGFLNMSQCNRHLPRKSNRKVNIKDSQASSTPFNDLDALLAEVNSQFVSNGSDRSLSPTTGTKLAQLARKTSKIEQS